MALIAVTGGIGAGKSTVLSRFKLLGADILDADLLVHGLYRHDAGLKLALLQRWGANILDADGLPERSKIASRVFDHAEELAWLNSILHPKVKAAIKNAAGKTDQALFCAIPLFFECAWEAEALCSISLWCDPCTQRQRLMARGWSEAEILSRLQHQLGMDEKLRRARFAIISNCSWQVLYAQCDLVYAKILRMLAGHQA
ncbi:MAG: dephospho-CoA kinase [Lentisphaeria bacterium]|jgi:dephospho-CoA kinase|nr:dephospho-CoA kinase [Lentisphaeria bacterium]MDY0176004.1 dephospho-CoA kinase [Lentisphaeria bacterium]NLZ60628.1 dephospho-CoA kinase [Lentisphaerota bacterium]